MPDLGTIIREAAGRYGLSPEMMLRIAQIESGMNPRNANPRSSARGVYQFMTKPGGSWGEYGRGQDVLDPHANVDAGARYIKDNMATLRTKLGREPADWEVYLAHQQGRAGAPALLANPNARAVDVLSQFYRKPGVARDAVVLNGGREDMTAGEFAALWKAKYEGTNPSGGGRAARVASAAPASAAGTAPQAINATDPIALQQTGAQVTNPQALAFAGPAMLGSVFTDALAPLKKPVDPNDLIRKPKSVGNILGDLGQPVHLSGA